MRVLVTGSTGLIGSALVPFLTTGGHEVIRLVRSRGRAGSSDALWDPMAGTIDAAKIEGIDAAVHLAGDNVGAGRWTESRKARIRQSRERGTRLLCETLARLKRPPRVLVSASATGYYGNRGAELLDEEAGPGRGFLAEVCRAWEDGTRPAEEAGIRVVRLRIAVVLTTAGGALPRMLTPFRLGLGGRLGSGSQFMPWIAIDDLVGVIGHAIAREDLRGPVNAASPGAVTNAEFTRVLARVLRRPALFPVPAAALRLMFGEMAEQMLLSSQRVEPAKLRTSGYLFRHPDLEGALRHLLGREVAKR